MANQTVIVTGGSGYLGGAACLRLRERGYRPISLDRVPLQKGDWESHVVDLSHPTEGARVWDALPPFDAVLHFAALALVGESFEKPEEYRRNNVQAARLAAEGASRRKAKVFVHSSSCSVYGNPNRPSIPETTPFGPLSPYGESKLFAEKALAEISGRSGLSVIHLRYFNPAGALAGLKWGERHEPETHVIPVLLRAARQGAPFSIFGTDYPTPDGTCVRDYIHLEDLIDAHVLTLERLESGAALAEAINLGSGRGTSILELIRAAETASGRTLKVARGARRPGDPPFLVAEVDLARRQLGWSPKHNLSSILSSHWAWETRKE